MHARDAIAFMGALRGLPIAEGRRRADALLAEHNLGDWAKKPIRTLSKGMAQTVQLLGTIIHKPRLIVLDEPFSGLDAINQARLEELIRREARAGVTIIFSTHVIAHAERLCEQIAIIAKGKVAFDGSVDEARAQLRPIVRLRTRASDGQWRSAIPAGARREGDEYVFELPEGGPEPLLKALIDGGAGIETLAIERPGLHDAFVSIAGKQRRGRNGPGEAAMMRFLRSAFVIARRDFSATVLSKAFIFFLLGAAVPVAARRRVRRHRRTRRRARPSGRWSRSLRPQADFERLEAARDRLAEAVGDDTSIRLVGYPPESDFAAQQKRLLASHDPPIRAVLSGGLERPASDRRRQRRSDDGGQIRLLIDDARRSASGRTPDVAVTDVPPASGHAGEGSRGHRARSARCCCSS